MRVVGSIVVDVDVLKKPARGDVDIFLEVFVPLIVVLMVASPVLLLQTTQVLLSVLFGSVIVTFVFSVVVSVSVLINSWSSLSLRVDVVVDCVGSFVVDVVV